MSILSRVVSHIFRSSRMSDLHTSVATKKRLGIPDVGDIVGLTRSQDWRLNKILGQ